MPYWNNFLILHAVRSDENPELKADANSFDDIMSAARKLIDDGNLIAVYQMIAHTDLVSSHAKRPKIGSLDRQINFPADLMSLPDNSQTSDSDDPDEQIFVVDSGNVDLMTMLPSDVSDGFTFYARSFLYEAGKHTERIFVLRSFRDDAWIWVGCNHNDWIIPVDRNQVSIDRRNKKTPCASTAIFTDKNEAVCHILKLKLDVIAITHRSVDSGIHAGLLVEWPESRRMTRRG